jgi:exodeoxyribonuclease VII small subunit
MAKSENNHQVSQTDVDQLSLEQALSELDQLVAQLEANENTLENALAYYERGQLLIKHCQDLLARAELKVMQLSGENLTDFSTSE